MAASTVLRNSLSLISGSPRASRWAFMTIRRYFVTVTPGIATGYWNAMNRPARARSSGSASVMSSPRKRIWPSVTSRFGWPMMTFASVDLPEPFGPMRAWISPLLTDRSRPLRIFLSPAWTCRLRISRSAMCSGPEVGGRFKSMWRSGADGLADGSGADLAALERDELGERGLGERVDHAALDPGPQQLRGAAVAVVDQVRAQHAAVLRIVHETGHRRDGALQGEDGLVHVDRRRVAREAVAAVRAAGALHEGGLLQERDDALEVGERQALGLGDRLQRDGRAVLVVAAELDEQAHSVLPLPREDHGG